jgi:hypothetical protein
MVGMLVGGIGGWQMSQLSLTQPQINQDATGQFVLPGGLIPQGGGGGGSGQLPTQSKGPGFVREQFQLGSGLGEMPMPPSAQGQMPVDMAKSSGAVTPGDSSDQFVCEAYKNGQLVSSTLS